jgi:GrpB-like predicted nucleotidyltransferase (UPF0157 family)
MKVEVVPPNLAWREEFSAESKRIALVMGENIVTIHHIGSTTIPGIYAKPVIDFGMAKQSLAVIDYRQANAASPLLPLYQPLPMNFGIQNHAKITNYNFWIVEQI